MSQLAPELVITMDKITFGDMHKILTASGGLHRTDADEMPTGWGTYCVSVSRYQGQKRCVVLVRFPHLSRFKIFGRAESEPYTRKIVTEMTRFMR